MQQKKEVEICGNIKRWDEMKIDCEEDKYGTIGYRTIIILLVVDEQSNN